MCSDRIFWLDNARIFAALAVVYIHVTAPYVLHSTPTEWTWQIANIIDAAMRWSVPFFVMISGALVLSDYKYEQTVFFYAKRAKKIFIPLVFWSVFYFAWNIIKLISINKTINIQDLISQLISGRIHYHIWFMYMLLGLYLATPLLKQFISYIPKKYYKKLLVVCISIIVAYQCLNWFYRIPKGSFIFWFLPYIPYFYAGFLLSKIEVRLSKKILIFFVFLGVLSTAVGCAYFYKQELVSKGLWFYSYFSPTVLLTTIPLFLMLKKYRSPLLSAKRTALLSSYTLGIYLIHPVFIEAIMFLLDDKILFDETLWFLIFGLLVFGLSILSCLLLKSLPFFRRVI